jgi:hypothetical protein
MHPSVRWFLVALALTAGFAETAFASPLGSRLLPMVPPGAEVVAGFEDHPRPKIHGRLLMTTHNNRLDLDDWQALTGVDSKRVFDEVIEVAAAPSGGALSEHILLVAGRFDRARIFRSIEENGAQSTQFLGERILLIKPLTRERGDMLDTRWMAIIDNRTGILGTPSLVQQALRRYADYALPDPILEQRLTLLRPDVSSWNVLVPPRKTTNNLSFGRPYSVWAQLQEDAEVLMVAARFGSKIRIDFSVHADSRHGPEFFTRKAGFFTDALGTRPNPDATSSSEATSSPEATSSQDAQRRLLNFSQEPNRVQGSVELTSSEFDAWCEHLVMVRAFAVPSAASGN